MRTLYHSEEPLSGREIERRTGLSNRAIMVALADLTDMAAVHMDIEGNAHSYSLNMEHYLIRKGLKPAFDAEDQFWDDLRKTIRKHLNPRPIAVVVTGPIARDETLSTGRMDLTMLYSNARKRIRAFRSLESLAEELWDRHAINFEYELLDMNNMDNAENDALWRRVAREGILLLGTLP